MAQRISRTRFSRDHHAHWEQGSPLWLSVPVSHDTQCDLESKREVTTGEALEFAQLRGLAFMETSALDATGVHEAFLEVICRKSLRLTLSHSLSHSLSNA
jgi:hypothetical protein